MAGTTTAVDVKTTGYNIDTSKNYLTNAGAIFANVKYDTATKKWQGIPLGATVGGLKFNIVAELRQPQVDGLLVSAKGNDVFNSMTATIEGSYKEFKQSTISNAAFADATQQGDYLVLRGRNDIKDSDYYENVGFIGKVTGYVDPLVIIIKNAINTSGLTGETKDKDESSIPFKFEARADADKPEDFNGVWEVWLPTGQSLNLTPASGLTVTSVASATVTGSTKITVTPTKTSGNSYKYKSGATVQMPNVGDITTTGYQTWDGTVELAIATGQKILVVEVDASNKVVKAGQATVASKA